MNDKNEQGEGIIGDGLSKLFGRSYRTTIAGWASMILGGAVAIGTMAPGVIPPEIVRIAAALAPIIASGGLIVAKDSRVSGLPR